MISWHFPAPPPSKEGAGRVHGLRLRLLSTRSLQERSQGMTNGVHNPCVAGALIKLDLLPLQSQVALHVLCPSTILSQVGLPEHCSRRHKRV